MPGSMMDTLSAFKALPDNELRGRERGNLLFRIDDLLRLLGAPGDWGYGTKLATLTQILLEQRRAIVLDAEAKDPQP